jgi:hypothetical protein
MWHTGYAPSQMNILKTYILFKLEFTPKLGMNVA